MNRRETRTRACSECGKVVLAGGEPKLACRTRGCFGPSTPRLHDLCALRAALRRSAALQCPRCGRPLDISDHWRRLARLPALPARATPAEQYRLLLGAALSFARLQFFAAFCSGFFLALAALLAIAGALWPARRLGLLCLWQWLGLALLPTAALHAWWTAALRASPGACLYVTPVDAACFWACRFLIWSEASGWLSWLLRAAALVACPVLLARLLATCYFLAAEGWADLATICACLCALESRRELRRLRRAAARDREAAEQLREGLDEVSRRYPPGCPPDLLSSADLRAVMSGLVALDAQAPAAAASAARLAAAEAAHERLFSSAYVDRPLVESVLAARR
jgi:ribosomal protein S27AE